MCIRDRVYDGIGDRIEVVSLVERFGDSRAWTDTLACIQEVARDILRARGA